MLSLGSKIAVGVIVTALSAAYLRVQYLHLNHKVTNLQQTIKELRQEKHALDAMFANYKFSCEQKLTIMQKKRKVNAEINKVNGTDLKPGLHTLSF